MSDLFGNQIVGFPTRRLICVYVNRKYSAVTGVHGLPCKTLSCKQGEASGSLGFDVNC